MFDGLKEKLGRFQEDVEAEAEAETADAETTADATDGEAETADAEETAADEDLGLAKKAALAATGKTVITEAELEGPLERLEFRRVLFRSIFLSSASACSSICSLAPAR